MAYYINMEKITVKEYMEMLKTSHLSPSRMILRNKPDERLKQFNKIGIKNIKDLMILLKDKEKLIELSKTKSLSGDYLKLLLRELKTFTPKPVPIKDFTSVSSETVKKLKQINITNTCKLYNKILTPNLRKKLALEISLDKRHILRLAKLSDLSRIKWVNVKFAELLCNTEFDTTYKLSTANAFELLKELEKFNKKEKIYKTAIRLKDIEILIEEAKKSDLDIVY